MHTSNKHTSLADVVVVGGGLAGSEAAYQLAERGFRVLLYEMRPTACTPAHKTDLLAELVCSNSFRSSDAESSAVGILQRELGEGGSLIMACARKHRLPAGSALAVDRTRFAHAVTETLQNHPRIEIRRERVDALSNALPTVVATGPLTAEGLAGDIKRHSRSEALAFFDAIAPLVYGESLDAEVLWFQSRYDKSSDTSSDTSSEAAPIGSARAGGDYWNVPLTREQYEEFVEGLVSAPKVEFRDWERDTPYFEGCLPIEVMAERGKETLRFGPMKPVGLTNPRKPNERMHAVIQLRRDDMEGRLWNMVGFQTKMAHGAQLALFRKLPGFASAEFARLGGLHRNTFIDSPNVLDNELRFNAMERIRFAGQIVGVEGYLESAAMGFLAGLFWACELSGRRLVRPPLQSALGALLSHVAGERGGAADLRINKPAQAGAFQPMNINFGLFPVLTLEGLQESAQESSQESAQEKKQKQPKVHRLRGREKRAVLSARAHKVFKVWWNEQRAAR